LPLGPGPLLDLFLPPERRAEVLVLLEPHQPDRQSGPRVVGAQTDLVLPDALGGSTSEKEDGAGGEAPALGGPDHRGGTEGLSGLGGLGSGTLVTAPPGANSAQPRGSLVEKCLT
jgi:hypothetical protein